MITYLDDESALALLPERRPDSHKGDYGKILLLCGSRGYTGAAALAGMGALRSGAGLVYLAVPESIYAIEAVKVTEAVVMPMEDSHGQLSERAVPAIRELLPKMDAVLFGCGSGMGPGTDLILQVLLKEAECPLILDADGITLVSRHKDMLRGRTAPTILTPHDGEFARLHPADLPRVEQTVAMAKELGCVILRKGHRTLITDGHEVYCNRSGNPGMAVGGSGDVLSGILIGLLGQGMKPIEAAACGAWFHGRAGDLCAQELGQRGLLPTDMVACLPRLLR